MKLLLLLLFHERFNCFNWLGVFDLCMCVCVCVCVCLFLMCWWNSLLVIMANQNDSQGQNADEALAVLFWFLIVSLLIMYIISPHDLVSESRYGIVGLIDDILALIILFYLIAFLSAITPAVVTLFLVVFLVSSQMYQSRTCRKWRLWSRDHCEKVTTCMLDASNDVT